MLIAGKWISAAVSAAAQIGVADLLVNGPEPVEELARATQTDSRLLYRVLRATAAVGIFAEVTDGRFALTPPAEYLRSDVPGSMRHLAIMAGEDFMWRPYGHVVHALKTGEQPFEHVYGQRIFEYMEDHPEVADVFNDAMTALSRSWGARISADYDFSPFGVIADVGGGHGRILGSILRAHGGATGVLFDQPHVVDGALPVLRELGVQERVRRVGGEAGRGPPGRTRRARARRRCRIEPGTGAERMRPRAVWLGAACPPPSRERRLRRAPPARPPRAAP